MRSLNLFTGGGGGAWAELMLGWTHIGFVEKDTYSQKVIAQRIRDGVFDNAPIFDDINSFIESGAAQQYRGVTDVVSGGFPCQGFSVAGKSKGAFDPRNMWPQTLEVIRIVRPRFCFLENVPGLLSSRYFCCQECGCVEFKGGKPKVCTNCGTALVKTDANTFWYFGDILRDLSESGYDVRWRVLSAAEVGAPHLRKRVWIVAHDART